MRFTCGALLACALLSGCAHKEKYPPYSPHENLLSIVTEFQLLSARDPYRDPPGVELTGQSIAKATLVRLENYRAMHPNRSTPEILATKGRAFELLGDFVSAKRNYEEAVEFDTELRADSQRRAELLGQLIVAGAGTPPGDVEGTIALLARQAGEYAELARSLPDERYRALARRESERAEVARAELMAAYRLVLPDGERQTEDALEKLVVNHRESARALEHALRLAHFHRAIAEEEARLSPPETLEFSATRFKRHFDAAIDLLYRISQADGRPEKLVARHELDALLEYGEQVRARAK